MVFGASAQTLFTSLAVQVLVLASGVVAARALGAEDRGHLALLWVAPIGIALLGGFGLPQATTYYVARDATDPRQVVILAARATAVLSLLLAAIYAAVLFLAVDPAGHELRVAGLISVALIPCLLAQAVGLAVLQGTQRFTAFNLVRSLAPVIYTVGITLLYLLGWDSLVRIVAAVLAAWGIGAGVTWVVAVRGLPGGDGRAGTGIKEMLSFGLRGLFGSVSPIDDVRADQLLVGLVVDARALGLYVAAISFCNLPRFIAQSIGLVSYPRVASAETAAGAWAVVIRSSKIGIGLVAVTVIFLLLVVPFVLPFFFGKEFEDAVGLAQILLIAAFFLSIRRLFTEFCRGLGHPGYGSIGELISLLVLLVGSALLIPGSEETGIAWAVLAGSVVSAVLLAALLLRLHRRNVAPPPGG